MRILITGGAGLVGSHAAEHWAARGHQVTVLDNLMRSRLFGSARDSVEHTWRCLSERGDMRLIRGDIRDPVDLARALDDGADVVLHAAAQPGVGFSLAHPEEDFSINAQGTLAVLEAVRRRAPGAAVLYCSTNKVYGTNVDALPVREEPSRYAFHDGIPGVDETTPVDRTGHSPYGVSKLAGELYVQDYAHTYGLRTAVFRLSCICGTRQFGFEDQGWIAHFAIATILGRPITIYGTGKQTRDVLYVDDLVDVFDRFLESPLRHGVFNIGGGPSRSVSLLEVLDLLEQLTHRRSPVSFSDWRPHDQRVYITDTGKASRELGWQPRIAALEGIRRVVDWIGRHQALFQDAPPALETALAASPPRPASKP